MNFDNKEILITGGTGSLGKTLTKLLIKEHNPRGIRIFSRDEVKQWQMAGEIKVFQTDLGKQVPISYIIGDIRNYESLYRAFENVDIVINTAAMKQIPTCETNPLEAVMTNVDGTQNVIKAALTRNVKHVMHVSTDKAVHAVNLYGATKTVAEKLIIHANAVYSGRKDIKFSCCRYGNVLGSRGSIIPLFKKLIENNEPITVTHKDMTRFWITLPSVGRFLLHRLQTMEGGEIFVPNMRACKIIDLVRYVQPYDNYPITFTGIRQGEKMHECLIALEESNTVWEEQNGWSIKSHKKVFDWDPLADNGLYSNSIDNKYIDKKNMLEMLKEEV